jgi:DNA transposition AAA+ family ATPase
LAKSVGVDHNGRYVDVKSSLKYYLSMLDRPVVIIDEAGDLEYTAFLELKEMWNATENICGWYLMGAEGLREWMDRGIGRKKVGFKEMYSRYSGKYSSIVPGDRQDRINFYRKLNSDVYKANCSDSSKMNDIVKRCMTSDANGQIGGLRRLESLLILNQ